MPTHGVLMPILTFNWEPKRITGLNDALLDRPLGKTEVVRWKSSDGMEIDGLLTYPAFSAHGYAVFRPNVRGSGGRGGDFRTEDYRVPVAQGLMLYNALKARGVPVEMVLYPRSGHVVTEPRLVFDVLSRNLAWFEEHIPAGGR